jgi:hypothetical protein
VTPSHASDHLSGSLEVTGVEQVIDLRRSRHPDVVCQADQSIELRLREFYLDVPFDAPFSDPQTGCKLAFDICIAYFADEFRF